MRRIALVKNGDINIKRLMICESDSDSGYYLFLYDQLEDGSCKYDYLCSSLRDLYSSCEHNFGIKETDWQDIPDPMEHCQQDWIEPVRVKGRDIGKPQWGRFEKLVDGKWVEIKAPNQPQL